LENNLSLDPSKNQFFDRIIWWGRYIDDVCLLWTGPEDECISFRQYLNSINPNIKLTMEYNKDNIHFLDLDISKINKSCLHTLIFRKLTDGNTILRADSFQATRLKENIPYGQIQRVCRICYQETDYSVKSAELENCFWNRRYSAQVLKDEGIRAGRLDQWF
jgi:hypothetical protein